MPASRMVSSGYFNNSGFIAFVGRSAIGGKVVGKPIRATFAYAKSLDPKILSEVIGKRGASEAVAQMYRPYLVDGSFSDHSADIIPTYFKNVDVEEGLRMVELAHARILEKEAEEADN